MIFLVCVLLKTVELQLGMALGLFAIFAIMRFRSSNLSLRDMTYFFTVIGISVINAMASWEAPVRGMLTINGIIILSVLLLERFFHRDDFTVTTLMYDRLDLLQSARLQELLKDLSERTGEKIEKVEIKKIDLIKKVSEIEISYRNGVTV
jgi:hypothetical protein